MSLQNLEGKAIAVITENIASRAYVVSSGQMVSAIHHIVTHWEEAYAHTAMSYQSVTTNVDGEAGGETTRDYRMEPQVFYEFITCLPDVTDEFPDLKFYLQNPIFAKVQRDDIDNWHASFEEASIIMAGTDPYDAMQALRYEIVYAMESLRSSEDVLGPRLKSRFETLCRHILVSE